MSWPDRQRQTPGRGMILMPWRRRRNRYEHADEGRPGTVLTTEEARQGETSGNMRRVLGGSLALSVLAGAILYVTFFS